jgi:cell division control protein 24
VSSLSTFSTLSDDSTAPSTPVPQPLLTFHAGVLPATVSCDPATQLWALFQQGSPLCVVFNLVKPTTPLSVISSDDLKTCKKSIYDFILACKSHLEFDHADLFTISNVFSNETNDLLKIIRVINRVIDAAPSVFPDLEVEDELQQSDTISNILRELIETERKYVNDLETLMTYKTQLLEQNIINSEDLYMLFPNLDNILDYQRRVLISLEVNGLADPKYQRIGSIFIHAQSFFKLYEPWSIGQKAAIDFISSSPLKQKNSSLIIENDFELQSFLLKPVQRLCKYPLLLKQMVKSTDPALPNYNELMTALEISKKIANDVNENQRRIENVEVLKKLFDKVVDWKGYNVHSFGELLFFDKVIVNDNSKVSDEREFQVYLFENIIIFFKEIYAQQKKPTITLMKKSSTNLSLSVQEVLGLELKGRISIANIYNINTVSAHQLNISWSGVKDTGSFLMKFKNDETRTNWESCIRKLVSNLQEEYQTSIQMSQMGVSDRRSNGISMYSSQRSSYLARTNSEVTMPTSAPSSHTRQKSEIQVPSRRGTVDSLQSKRSISESYKSTLPVNSIIVKLIYEKDLFTMMVPLDIIVEEFLSKVEKKIKQCGGTMKGKVKYQDEDGDFIVIASDDDWMMVKEMMKEVGDKVLNVWVT